MKKIILLFAALFVTTNVSFAQNFTLDTLRLSLDDAIDKALNYNERLLSSKKQIEKSSYAVDEVKSIQYPQIDAMFSYNYLDIVPGFRSILLGNIQHDLFPRLNVEQVIYTGGKIENSIKLKEELMRGKEFSHQEQEQQIKFILSSYYYQLQSIGNQIKILENNKEQLQIQKKFSRLLIDAGKLSELEIGRIEVELANIDGKILNLENDYNSVSHNIFLLMGNDSFGIIIPTDSMMVDEEKFNIEELIDNSYEVNPTIKKYESIIKQGEINTELQKSSRLPQISAGAYYGYEFGFERFSFDKNDRYFIGLNAQLPLFDGGNITSKIQQAEVEIESAKYEMNYFAKQLSLLIDRTNRKIEETVKLMEIQKKALQQIKDTYRLALLEYQSGRRSNTDLLDIQKSLLNAEVALNDLQINYIVKQTELKYYSGIL
ncbi:MAG: TolC family protein [Melioribacteraceae bacterium]|nr:TolC family protein [Melioribacteraceae bacterium]